MQATSKFGASDESLDTGRESGRDNGVHSARTNVETDVDDPQNSAESIDKTSEQVEGLARSTESGIEEAVKAPLPSGSLWDDSDAELQEPLTETSTQLERDSWQDTERKPSLESSEQPTRQEDTELGIFRPDEL